MKAQLDSDFSDNLSAVDVIEREIVDEIEKIAKEDRDRSGIGDKDWTFRIKETLAKLGDARGYEVFAGDYHGPEIKGGEWLFDVTWIEYDASRNLVRIPLVAESEWALSGERRDPVDDDFQKLVVARADHRLMVFQAYNEERARSEIEGLLRHVGGNLSTFHDRYLFGCWLGNDKRMLWHLHIVGSS